MVNGQDWRKMADKTITTMDIQKAAANLAPHSAEMDSLYGSLFGSSPAGEYITNIIGKESHYGMPTSGYHEDNTYSMGLSQVDAIKYQDLLNDYNAILYNEETKKHHRSGRYHKVNKINEYMQSQPGYEDWDMTKLATIKDGKYTGFSKHAKDPRTAYMLTRMLLMKDKGAIPVSLDEQANAWDKMWNRNPEAGFPHEFIKIYQDYRANPVDDTMNSYNQVKKALPGR